MLSRIWLFIQTHPSETIAISGITLFSLLTSLALIQQTRRIWAERSGQSLSVVWIVYFIVMFASGAVYGWTTKDQVLLLNNVLFSALHLPVAYGLWKYKGFSKAERWFGVLLLLPLSLMVLSPPESQRWWFMAFAFGGIAALIRQTLEMWKQGGVGVVDPRLLIIYLLSNAFWTDYAFLSDELALKLICPLNLSIFIVMVGLWLRLKQLELKKASSP